MTGAGSPIENKAGGPATCLLLVDGHAFAYRAYFAIRRLTSPEGRPTQAILGFIKMLEKLRSQWQPTHWAVVWDGGLAVERLATLPEYKAQRPAMPEELAEQIKGIQEYLQADQVASLVQEGVEADDWIATLCRPAAVGLDRVLIASSDKDFMQLVSDHVGLVNPSDRTQTVWNDERVRQKTGVNPGQIIDWLSLIGDTVDNIPGVAGVGAKNAAKLLNKFGSIDELYAQLQAVEPETLRKRLAMAEPLVRRNQRLIRLKDDLPLPCRVEDLQVKPGEEIRLAALFKAWGFKLLIPASRGSESQRELF